MTYHPRPGATTRDRVLCWRTRRGPESGRPAARSDGRTPLTKRRVPAPREHPWAAPDSVQGTAIVRPRRENSAPRRCAPPPADPKKRDRIAIAAPRRTTTATAHVRAADQRRTDRDRQN